MSSSGQIVQRVLQFTFKLGTGTFGDSGDTQLTLPPLRASARIQNAGGPSTSLLNATIWGMTEDQINQLTTLGIIATTTRRNTVLVQAGDSDVISTVFSGTIYNAWGDFNSQPDVGFVIDAQGAFADAVAPCLPTSFKGSGDVATMLSKLAQQMGAQFENNGVTAQLSNPYFCGSARVQARAIVEAAGIEWNGLENNILAIWNPGYFRDGDVPEVSVNTGMIGYPAYNSQGIFVRTIYNPSIRMGGKINVVSTQKPASKIWGVNTLEHFLEADVPGGKWESNIMAAPLGYKIVPS